MLVLPVSLVSWCCLLILGQSIVQFILVHNRSIINIEIFEPLGVNEEVHPSEESEQDDGSSDDFCEKHVPLTEEHGVGAFADDSDSHVEHSQDNRQLHLDIVGEEQLGLG